MPVEDIIAAMARAWNAGDGAAWAASFAEDATFVDALGRVQRGRAVIAEEHQKIFDTIYRGSRLEYWLLDSRPIADDLLLAHTGSRLSVPEGPRAGTVEAVQTKLVRGGEILAFHNTAVLNMADFAGRDEALARRAPREWERGPHLS
ncbi:uncharacterized protein (TIGR02246 family) [Prauserella shujinwangii]|uniref:Uncharacterized protein (TIGR02246 family) n=1 Tax=Prauserella shujinwangii TaxID=1453103 RepID=A0A2T0M0A8_9PSEU|nr:SgcJ/EcaC family oxidoreductase [Prauserella shujinwangii]PRX50021.1 uncharacterized protein (TIGR02246 family) [Prauserella shujinwangii]